MSLEDSLNFPVLDMPWQCFAGLDRLMIVSATVNFTVIVTISIVIVIVIVIIIVIVTISIVWPLSQVREGAMLCLP